MSDVIRLLPDAVANQIAAGEVIQRPSSVIKELMENSIDAGARHVQVYITDAGKTCIQVIDNGKGMSETDARLSFERHATSKISQASDLFNLHTMGFRGEALASIAAVAQVQLRTRTEEEELGVSLTIEGSRITEQEFVACPVGANFSVNNLFYNVPARRKFLKSNQTELNNILTEFERIALAHPDIAFTLYNNGATLLTLNEGNFKQRILGVFGKKLDAQLIPVQVETPIIKISGFVGTPESAKKKGAYQYFFTNGRYMRHPYFAKAIQTAYERLIPENEQTSFFLNLEVSPSHIDVNIHPTKTEIKFQDEHPIWQILLAATREALGKFNAIPTIDFDTENRPDFPTSPSDAPVHAPQIKIDTSFNPFAKNSGQSLPASPSHRSSKKNVPWQDVYESVKEAPRIEPSQPGNETLYNQLPTPEKEQWEKEELSYIQYKGQYIVTPIKSGLLLIDQHRAHTRILYDQYRYQLANKKGIGQGLLFPQILQLPLSSISHLQNLMEDLQSVGFDITNIGGGSFSISSIPAGTEGLDPADLIQSMIAEAQAGKTNGVKDDISHIIAFSLAKKAALPTGQELSRKEMGDLIDKLFSCDVPNKTPDAKPIVVIIEHTKIEKLFS